MIENPIPYGRQNITDQDIEAVNAVLRSDFLTQGPKVNEFEDAFADYLGCKYAVAVANGTAALHLSAIALNVRPGQKVITTPITFAASANCVRYCGGEISLVDIDPHTYILNLEKVRELIESSPRGTYAGIIPVDFTGYPANLEEFRVLADEHGLWILEDACHAPGGYFIDGQGDKRFCGDGSLADLAIFSFHPVKHIATGEGGMITTNSESLYQRLKILRTHGITKDQDLMSENPGGWYYEMVELGYNYRLTDIQAALGLSQLHQLNDSLSKRQEITEKYDVAFSQLGIVGQKRDPNFYNAHHLYVIETDRRTELYNFLRERKILAQVHYIPLHYLPYYKDLGLKADLSHSENYYNRCLSLPIYPSLSEEEQDYVIQSIQSFF